MKNLVSALVFASIVATIAMPVAAHNDRLTPPLVPDEIRAPANTKPFLAAHAVGTQGYVCVAVGTSFTWAPYGPQATLFNEEEQQMLTHFLSPNPFEGTLYPTWQHSRDTSAIWGQLVRPSSDPNYVAPGAIPWLLLEVVVAQEGPAYGDKLTPATYIQRVNTAGGKAPTTGCAEALDIAKRALVPYEADYYFFKERRD